MKPSTKRALVDVASFVAGWGLSEVAITIGGMVKQSKGIPAAQDAAEGMAANIGATSAVVAYLGRDKDEAYGLFASGMGASAANRLFRVQRARGGRA